MILLRTVRGFDVDPLIGIMGALAGSAKANWGAASALPSHPFPVGRKHGTRGDERRGQVVLPGRAGVGGPGREKVAQPLYAVVLRVAAQADTKSRAWEIVRALGGALTQFANPTSNELIPLANDGYDDADHAADVCNRTTHRSGMLLNADELVSLAHLPSASVRVPQLKREDARTKAAHSRDW